MSDHKGQKNQVTLHIAMDLNEFIDSSSLPICVFPTMHKNYFETKWLGDIFLHFVHAYLTLNGILGASLKQQHIIHLAFL